MAPTQQQSQARKAQQLAGGKAPKARIQRYLKKTEPQLREVGAKSSLLLKGIRASASMGEVLKELRAMQAPNAKLLSKKNQITAFEADGQESLEFLCTKNDTALFALASHNKKRPNNLVIGRTFDRQVLDMAELGILRFKSMANYGGTVPKKRVGSKPLLLFVGDVWQHSSDFRNLQNLLTDFYRGEVVDKLVLPGMDHLIMFAAVETNSAGGVAPKIVVHQRTYHCQLKKNPQEAANGGKSGTSHPLPYLTPCGPDLDIVLRRTQWADADRYKAARRQPEGLRRKKIKNQSTNIFGERIGRLHMQKQDVDNRQGRKSKALRRAEKTAAEEEQAALEEELEKERRNMDDEFKQSFGFERPSSSLEQKE